MFLTNKKTQKSNNRIYYLNSFNIDGLYIYI